MKVPFGKGVKSYRIGEHRVAEILEEAIVGKLTGYVRVTTEKNGVIEDYYIFLNRGTLAGAVAEMGGEEINRQEALDKALEVSSGIASVFSYNENQLLNFFKMYPAVECKLAFTYVAPMPKKQEVAVFEVKKEEPKKFFRIANIKVPYNNIHEISRNIAGINLRVLIEKLAGANYTGAVRITAEAQEKLEEGLVIMENGKLKLILHDTGKALERGDDISRIEALLTAKKGLVNIYTMSGEDISKVMVQFGESTVHVPPAPEEKSSNGNRDSLLKKYHLKEPDEELVDQIINGILREG